MTTLENPAGQDSGPDRGDDFAVRRHRVGRLQQEVDPGGERQHRRGATPGEPLRGRHRQRIADDDAVEPELVAEQIAQHTSGKRCRGAIVVQGGIRQVRSQHAVDSGA